MRLHGVEKSAIMWLQNGTKNFTWLWGPTSGSRPINWGPAKKSQGSGTANRRDSNQGVRSLFGPTLFGIIDHGLGRLRMVMWLLGLDPARTKKPQ